MQDNVRYGIPQLAPVMSELSVMTGTLTTLLLSHYHASMEQANALGQLTALTALELHQCGATYDEFVHTAISRLSRLSREPAFVLRKRLWSFFASY